MKLEDLQAEKRNNKIKQEELHSCSQQLARQQEELETLAAYEQHTQQKTIDIFYQTDQQGSVESLIQKSQWARENVQNSFQSLVSLVKKETRKLEAEHEDLYWQEITLLEEKSNG